MKNMFCRFRKFIKYKKSSIKSFFSKFIRLLDNERTKVVIDIIMTITTVIALVVAIYSTNSANKISQNTLEEMRYQRKKSFEPFVVVDSDLQGFSFSSHKSSSDGFIIKSIDKSDSESIFLNVKNTGLGTANFVKITFDIQDYFTWLDKVQTRYNKTYSKHKVTGTNNWVVAITEDNVLSFPEKNIQEEILFLLPEVSNDFILALPKLYTKIISDIVINFDVHEIPPIKMYFEFNDVEKNLYKYSAILNFYFLDQKANPSQKIDVDCRIYMKFDESK